MVLAKQFEDWKANCRFAEKKWQPINEFIGNSPTAKCLAISCSYIAFKS